jgi:hypothetical protein
MEVGQSPNWGCSAKEKKTLITQPTGARRSVVGSGNMLRADSFTDEVVGIFNLPNPSSRTIALVSTQPLTEMNTRNLPGIKGRPLRKADNLTAIYEPFVEKTWEPRRLTNLWYSTPCYRDSFSFFFFSTHPTIRRYRLD